MGSETSMRVRTPKTEKFPPPPVPAPVSVIRGRVVLGSIRNTSLAFLLVEQ